MTKYSVGDVKFLVVMTLSIYIEFYYIMVSYTDYIQWSRVDDDTRQTVSVLSKPKSIKYNKNSNP